jgi:hypothetical protein
MWPMAVAPHGSFYLHNQPMLDQFLINKNMVGLQTPSCLQFSAGSLAERSGFGRRYLELAVRWTRGRTYPAPLTM